VANTDENKREDVAAGIAEQERREPAVK
jgi:hypothetical protein